MKMKVKKDCIVCTYYETILKWLATQNDNLSYSTIEVSDSDQSLPELSLTDKDGIALDIETEFQD